MDCAFEMIGRLLLRCKRMCVMESLKAVPTEYRGIRYRSKSEAMFARWLDLSRQDSVRKASSCMTWFESVWVYEPNLTWLGGFSCDFYLCWIEIQNNVTQMKHRCIEYKPSRPTNTYCSNLFDRFDKCKYLSNVAATGVSVDCFVFFGSVYNKDRGVVKRDSDGRLIFCELDWIFAQESEEDLKNYRFDLESAGCHASER